MPHLASIDAWYCAPAIPRRGLIGQRAKLGDMETPVEEDSFILPPPIAAEAPPRAQDGAGQYTVGTLTYTRRSLAVLSGWLLWGDLAWQIKDRSIGSMFQLLVRQFHARNLLASILLVTVPQIIGISMGPIISTTSDRHRGRFGRRIPFILLPTPFAALSIIALGFAPMLGRWFNTVTGGGPETVDRSILLFLGIFWVVFDITTTIANSAFIPLVNDVVPSTFLGRFYGLFRAVSLIAGIAFQYWLFGKTGEHYLPICVGVGLLYGIAVPMMCWKVKEGKYPAPAPIDALHRSPLKFFLGFGRECFSKPYYLWVFAAIILPNLARLPMDTFNLYFAQSVGTTADRFGKLTALSFVFSLTLTFPLGWLVDRYHSLRMAMVALLLHGTATLLGALYIHNQTSFAVAFVTTNTLAGVWITSTAPLTSLLLPRMKFAQYACGLGILNSLLNLGFAPMFGAFLDYSHNQYRYTYYSAVILEAAGFIATFVLFAKFTRLGGPKRYVAPE
jgi:MFS family permease